MSKTSKMALTHIATHDDGKFTRTALVLDDADTGSVALIRPDGTRVALINITFHPNSDGEESLSVDVIDVDRRYSIRHALTFSVEGRTTFALSKTSNLVCANFRKKV
jgi:hypothetical protein